MIRIKGAPTATQAVKVLDQVQMERWSAIKNQNATMQTRKLKSVKLIGDARTPRSSAEKMKLKGSVKRRQMKLGRRGNERRNVEERKGKKNDGRGRSESERGKSLKK